MGNLVTGLLGALVLGALGSWLFLWVAKREGECWLGYLLIAALALRLLVVFLVSPVYYSHYTINDSNTYDQLGMQFASHLRQGQLVPLDTYFNQVSFQVSFYGYLTGMVYALLGPSRYLMEVINSLVSTFGIFYFYKGLKLVLSTQHLRVAVVLIALMPSLLLWNSLHLRDPWVFLSIGLFTYGSVLCMGTGWLKPFTVLGISLIGMLLFRSHLAAIGIAAAVPLIVLFKPLGSGRAAHFARWGGIAFLVASGALLLMEAQRLAIGDRTLSYEVIEQVQNSEVGGDSALPPVHFSSWWDVLFYLPQGMLNVLFRPLPWEVYNLPGLLASLENVFLIVLLVLSVPQWPRFVRREARALWPSWVFLLLLLAVLGLIMGNLGGIFRQKAQLMPFLLILGALGLVSLWERLRTVQKRVT